MKRLIVVITSLIFGCCALPASAVAQPRATGSTTTAAVTPVKHKKHKVKRHHVKRVSGQKAPTADRINEIQTALSRDGYYQGEPSGKWDSNTVAAVQKFQSSNGMDANGKLDAPTLQRLGLGSDIAGVSAPKPIVPGSQNAAPSSSVPSGVPQTSVSSRGGPIASAASSPSSSPSSSSQNPSAATANH